MRKLLLLGLTAAVLAAGLLPADAQAIPAFARRHKLSCSTCHNPFPRLKAFGDEFAGNGFYLPEDDDDRDYVKTGDDLLRLNRTFPVAGRMDLWFQWQQDGRVDSDFQVPWGLKLLSGGTLARDVGYYFYFYMSEQGEVAGIEDAYVHFNDLFGVPLDVLVGQFQVCDPLMKRELRLTYEDYEAYTIRVGDSRSNLTYDRGLMVPFTVEATGTDIIGMVVNGNGKPESGEDVVGKYDRDVFKAFGARLNQDLVGVASVGLFGYWNKERLEDPGQTLRENRVTYYGVDATFSLNGYVDFTGQYLRREDTTPVVADPAVTDVKTDGIVAELVISPQQDRGRHTFTLLYNDVDSDLDGDDYRSYTAGVTYLMARNLRLSAEYTLLSKIGDPTAAPPADLQDVTGLEDKSRISVGLIGAF